MNRQKMGKILFWVGIFCAIPFHALNWMMTPVHRVNSLQDLSGSVWSPAGGALFAVWQLASVITIVLPILGALILSGKKGSRFWLWGLVPFITYNIGVVWKPSQYSPPLFGIGGGIILVSYLGILWLSNRTSSEYEGVVKTGKQIQLLGYSFLLVTALFLCQYIGNPNLPAMAEMPNPSAEIILVTLSISMVLLFVGQYVVGRNSQEVATS